VPFQRAKEAIFNAGNRQWYPLKDGVLKTDIQSFSAALRSQFKYRRNTEFPIRRLAPRSETGLKQ